ncbi:MAG: phage baseplate assembly protein V [Burkholderiaceae bacterium]
MAEEAVKFGWTQDFGAGAHAGPPDKKVFGVTTATVIDSVDCNGEAKVQLQLPWLPGYMPWARLSTPMAGLGHGTYFIPQIGAEVLVAFNHGDVREPYVLGSTWNGIDRPPSTAPTDPVNKRRIRTPLGHELVFDELLQSVTLTSNTQSTVTLDPEQAVLSTPTASVKIGKAGDVTITAATKLTLSAPVIEISADMLLTLSSDGNASVTAAGPCAVKGAPVKLN